MGRGKACFRAETTTGQFSACYAIVEPPLARMRTKERGREGDGSIPVMELLSIGPGAVAVDPRPHRRNFCHHSLEITYLDHGNGMFSGCERLIRSELDDAAGGKLAPSRRRAHRKKRTRRKEYK